MTRMTQSSANTATRFMAFPVGVVGWIVARAPMLWIACILAILLLSLIPADTPAGNIGQRWIWNYGHIAGYAVLSALTIPLASRTGAVSMRVRLLVYAGIVLFGASIEIVQPFLGRDGNIQDAAFDLLGVALGACCGALIFRTPDSRRAPE